ncbi:hypothetical protein [Spiroplasma sp. DGKH1]|uniref:hypothetical protein n=1 Tax=Spiroplasma sp. DGKH1 TaxID=3050074 RepID=UPI0034C619A5
MGGNFELSFIWGYYFLSALRVNALFSQIIINRNSDLKLIEFRPKTFSEFINQAFLYNFLVILLFSNNWVMLFWEMINDIAETIEKCPFNEGPLFFSKDNYKEESQSYCRKLTNFNFLNFMQFKLINAQENDLVLLI